MFFKWIDKYNIQVAPRPLRINGQDIFTNDEKIYNQYGYYRLEQEEYPDDGQVYSPYYELVENVIYEKWEVENDD